MVAPALRKLHDRHTHFRKKVSVEEQRAQNNDRCLRGRQIALYDLWPFSFNWILWWNSMSIRSVQNSITQRRCSGFWSTLETSNFINRWPTSRQNSEKSVQVKKLQDSSQLQTVLSLYNQDLIRIGGEPACHRLRMCAKLHIDHTLRNKKFKILNEMVERGIVSKSLEEDKPFVERKEGERFQWKANGSCSKGESCSFSATPLHRVTVANFKVKVEVQAALDMRQHQDTDTVINSWKNNHPQLHQNRRPRMTCRLQRVEEKVLQRGWEFLADLERDAKIRHLIFGILPYVIITKLNRDANVAEIANSDRVMLKRHPAQSRGKRVLKDQLLYCREKYKLDLKIPIRRSLFYGKLQTWHRTRQRDTTWNSQEAPGTKLKIRESKARESGPHKQRGTWRKKVYKLKNKDKTMFYFPVEERANLVQNPQRSEGLLLIQEVLCTCGAKEICVQQKWIRWDDPGPPSRWWQQMVKSKQPRKREHTYMILVCSWLCKYSQKRQQFYRLVSFAKSTDIHMSGSAVKNYGWPKMERQLLAKLIISYLLSHQVGHPASRSGSSSTSRMQDTTPSESQDPDKTRSDSPASGNRDGTDSDKMDRDYQSQAVPEWLQNFTENLEESEIPVPAHTSQEDSDSERSYKRYW